jgi:FMNH2-dependent dimethyl sulfone monooxygenase
MQFGVWLPVYGGWLRVDSHYYAPTFDICAQVACCAEDNGFDYVYGSENFLNCVYGPSYDVADVWSYLGGIAARTSRIRLVAATKPGFFHPLVAAQITKSLDVISAGRLEVNLVCGWWRQEFEQAAIPFLTHSGRYDRGREFADCLKRLWTEDEVNYSGAYYTLDRARLPGKPVQKPHPPLWVSGQSDNAIDWATAHAGTLFLNSFPDEDVSELVARIKAQAQRAGNSLRIAMNAFVILGKTDHEAVEHYESLLARADTGRINEFRDIMADSGAAMWTGLTDAQMIDSNCGFDASLVGSPETVAARIDGLRKMGVDILMLQFEDMVEGTRAFGSSVLPMLKSSQTMAGTAGG